MRIDKPHRTPLTWLPAVLLILIQTIVGMRDMPQFSFFLIYLQEQLRLKPVIISSVVAGGQVAGMLMALLGGTIIARLGVKHSLVIGLVIAALGSLTFLIHSLPVVALVWIIAGGGASLVTVSGASYLTRISARGSIGLLAAFYALGYTVGGAIGNPIAGVLIEQHGFPIFTWAALPLSIGLALIVTLLMEDMRDKASSQVLPAAEKPSPRTLAVSLKAFWESVRFTVRQTNIRYLVGLRSLPTLFYGTLMVLIPLLLNDRSGSKVLVAAYGTTNLIVASAAQLLVGRAADRWGARVPTLLAYGGVILSGLGLALTVNTVWGLYAFGVLGITAAWALSTLMYVWINDGVPKEEHPSTFGLLHAVWNLSMISGSLIGGWFVATLPGLPFAFAGLMNVVSLVLITAYYGRNQGLGKEIKELGEM